VSVRRLKFFEIHHIFGQFESKKQKDKKVSLILTILLVMLFFLEKTFITIFPYHIGRQTDSDSNKNLYYDLLGNENIN